MTKVKICGITNVADALAATDAGADFLGLVLSPSPRRVDITNAEPIVSVVAGRAGIVGVFASEADLLAYDKECSCPLDYYQVYFEYNSLPVRQPKRNWIRSYWIRGPGDLRAVMPSDLVLCDFKRNGANLLHEFSSAFPDLIRRRTFIAGNLTVENVGAVVSTARPFGVDVARGTELSPGVKDIEKVEQFIQRAKNA